MEPNQITKFEAAFTEHLKASHQGLLDNIREAGQISDDVDAKLKEITANFVAGYQP